jgi:hypothetical protein
MWPYAPVNRPGRGRISGDVRPAAAELIGKAIILEDSQSLLGARCDHCERSSTVGKVRKFGSSFGAPSITAAR